MTGDTFEAKSYVRGNIVQITKVFYFIKVLQEYLTTVKFIYFSPGI